MTPVAMRAESGGCVMRIGFTGTRHGMTNDQVDAVSTLLDKLPHDEIHHGDCVGADAEFHSLSHGGNGVRVKRVGHPPRHSRYRAFCKFDEEREPRDYMPRNRDIVNETDVLIAAPKTMEPPTSLKGEGTWSTYFYARDKAKKPTYLVLPDGTVKEED